MMSDTQLRTAVLDAIRQIAPEADPSTLAPAAPLREQLDLDSFDFLQILVALEKQTGVGVPEKDYARVGSLDALVGYLRGRLS